MPSFLLNGAPPAQAGGAFFEPGINFAQISPRKFVQSAYCTKPEMVVYCIYSKGKEQGARAYEGGCQTTVAAELRSHRVNM